LGLPRCPLADRYNYIGTYKANRGLQNTLVDYELADDVPPRSTVNSPHKIRVWADTERSKLIKAHSDNLRTSEECEEQQLAAELRRVPYLRAITRPRHPLEENDLALLPSRIPVYYALRSKKYVSISVRDLKSLT